MRVIFSSGAEVTFDVTDFTVAQNTLTGELSKLTWTHTDDSQELMRYLRLDEVVCVIRADDVNGSEPSEDAGAVKTVVAEVNGG